MRVFIHDVSKVARYDERLADSHSEFRRLLYIPVGPNTFQAENINSLIFLADINAAAPVDENVFGLRDESARLSTDSHFGIGRDKVAHILRHARVANIVDSQARVKVGKVGNIVAILEASLMIGMVLIVRAETSAFLIKIL